MGENLNTIQNQEEESNYLISTSNSNDDDDDDENNSIIEDYGLDEPINYNAPGSDNVTKESLRYHRQQQKGSSTNLLDIKRKLYETYPNKYINTIGLLIICIIFLSFWILICIIILINRAIYGK